MVSTYDRHGNVSFTNQTCPCESLKSDSSFRTRCRKATTWIPTARHSRLDHFNRPRTRTRAAREGIMQLWTIESSWKRRRARSTITTAIRLRWTTIRATNRQVDPPATTADQPRQSSFPRIDRRVTACIITENYENYLHLPPWNR